MNRLSLLIFRAFKFQLHPSLSLLIPIFVYELREVF
nr:MAG TPA: hypothetical protein [Caudoviricetes sp.]